MCLKEWKVQANMTSAENKEYSGGWGWKGVVNVVHVRVCATAKMCVGVPWGCLHVTECFKLLSADRKQDIWQDRDNGSGSVKELFNCAGAGCFLELVKL